MAVMFHLLIVWQKYFSEKVLHSHHLCFSAAAETQQTMVRRHHIREREMTTQEAEKRLSHVVFLSILHIPPETSLTLSLHTLPLKYALVHSWHKSSLTYSFLKNNRTVDIHKRPQAVRAWRFSHRNINQSRNPAFISSHWWVHKCILQRWGMLDFGT